MGTSGGGRIQKARFEKLFYSNSDDYTRQYYDSLLIEPRYIGADLASVRAEYFGKCFSSPIMIAPLAANMANGELGSLGLAKAAAATNTLYWGSHLTDEDVAEIAAAGVSFITCSKPLADHDMVVRRIWKAEQAGATAFFIDIDHLFAKDGGWDNFADRGGEPDRFGGNAGRQSVDDLRRYAECSGLPIILKGVLSVHDALKCKEAGIAAIAVSHHHGQVHYSIPPVLAVQNIRKSVGDNYPVFVYCGIRSGIDAFKALALGADGVMIARGLMGEYASGGTEAVVKKLNSLTQELQHYMNLTSSPDLKHIDPSCIVKVTV
ncbi:MAG: alpha-hydroxy-acid oxidizing protein [Oscillospiraceae bacterium]|nr:alpha-hydroxy-acid oxidizing protein [Oscillospiraceae bacterium]